MNITYRNLAEYECERIKEIDASTFVKRAWRNVDGVKQWVELNWQDEDFPEGYENHLAALKKTFENCGSVIGAFDDGQLIGFCSINRDIFGSQYKYILLDQIFISKEYKRKGIGKKLFFMSVDEAKMWGADKFYICAGSSEDTLAFYASLGCEPAKEIMQELYELDENDIQLEYDFSAKELAASTSLLRTRFWEGEGFMQQKKSTVRPLQYEDLGDFWEISDGFYPGDKERRVKWFHKLMTELPDFAYYGAFRDGKMAGGMAIGDFGLNIRSQMVKVSSVGMVRTDMLHKKEKICKDMMEYFIEASLQKGINILTLTPFRPDFYKQMGFGYGSTLYTYRIPPLSFPDKGVKDFLSYSGNSEKQGIIDCFNRVCGKTHGAVSTTWKLGIFEEGKRIVVYKADEVIRGSLVFSFGKEREMVIEDMFYEDTKVLQAFCSFLHSQSDQFDRVVYSTADEYFYYLLHDPRDGMDKNECCTSTISNMFRVIDVAGLFNELSSVNFNNQNAVLEISVKDTFYPQNSGITVVKFTDGKALVSSGLTSMNYDSIKIHLDIADFSSLIMGAVNIKTLYRLGLLEISDTDNLDLLESIFLIGQKPLSIGGL